MGAVVEVERHGQGAAGPVAGVQAGDLAELGHEGRIAPGGFDVEGEQGLLAVVQLGDGGEHPGRDLGRAAARLGVHEHDTEAEPRRPPGGHQSDDPTPDHHHVGPVPRYRRCDLLCAERMGVQPLPSPA